MEQGQNIEIRVGKELPPALKKVAATYSGMKKNGGGCVTTPDGILMLATFGEGSENKDHSDYSSRRLEIGLYLENNTPFLLAKYGETIFDAPITGLQENNSIGNLISVIVSSEKGIVKDLRATEAPREMIQDVVGALKIKKFSVEAVTEIMKAMNSEEMFRKRRRYN